MGATIPLAWHAAESVASMHFFHNASVFETSLPPGVQNRLTAALLELLGDELNDPYYELQHWSHHHFLSTGSAERVAFWEAMNYVSRSQLWWLSLYAVPLSRESVLKEFGILEESKQSLLGAVVPMPSFHGKSVVLDSVRRLSFVMSLIMQWLVGDGPPPRWGDTLP